MGLKGKTWLWGTAVLLALAGCGEGEHFDDAPGTGAEAPEAGGAEGGGEATGSVADDPENLLLNPVFAGGEQPDGCPVDWACVSYNPRGAGLFSVDATVSLFGGASASWQAETGEPISVIKQLMSSAPGHVYEASAWTRSEDLVTAPHIQVLFLDAAGSVITHTRLHGESGTGDWARIRGTVGPAPAGTVQVSFNLSTSDSAGRVWWDEARLADVSPQDLGPPPADEPPPVDDRVEGVDLCALGLSEGDVINPHLLDHLAGGQTLIVCGGTYRIDGGLHLRGNDWTVIAPEGATLVAQGTTVIRTSGNRYRLSGFVFDQRAPSTYVALHPSGDDWVIDHVAWKGVHPGGGRLMAPSVDSPNASGLVDRMYMGDGQVEGSLSGAIWVNRNAGHYGDLTFRRAYIAHFIDNAIYGTGPGTGGQPGRTHVEDSFLWSNTISNVRIGSPGSRVSYVRRTVFVLDDTTQMCWEKCSSPGARTTRAVWAWHGPVHIEDSDFIVTHGTRIAVRDDGASVTEQGNRVGAAARVDPPAGVPTHADWILENPPGWPRR